MQASIAKTLTLAGSAGHHSGTGALASITTAMRLAVPAGGSLHSAGAIAMTASGLQLRGPIADAVALAHSPSTLAAKRHWMWPIVAASAMPVQLQLQLAQPRQAATTAAEKDSGWTRFWRQFGITRWEAARAVAAALLVVAGAGLSVVAASLVASLTTGAGAATVVSVKTATLLGLAILGRALATYLGSTTLTAAVESISSRVRLQLLHHVLEADASALDATTSGQISSVIDEDVRQVRDAIRSAISSGLSAGVRLAGGAAALVALSPQLSAAALGALVCMVPIGNLLAADLRRSAQRTRKARAAATATSAESIAGVRTLRVLGDTAHETMYSKFDSQLGKSSELANELGSKVGMFHALVGLGLQGLFGGLFYYGSQLVASGQLTAGDVASAGLHSLNLQAATESLSVLYTTLLNASTSAGRICDLMEFPVQTNRAGGKTWDRVAGDILLSHVSFAYPSRPGMTVLHDVSLHVPAGKVVAIVGPSGSGKSTLLSLLQRVYDPVEGSVLVDGNNLSLTDIRWFRKHVACVPQNPDLFAMSIADNIRLGCPDATDEQVEAAARTAQAHEFISEFPDGYNTTVGERGMQLSGGQRQRIAVARAVLRNPRVLLLDEATSALDAESEARMQQAMSLVMPGRTVVIVAHRLSTVERADHIVVMEDGFVVETGNHATLLKKGGVYASLVKHQLSRTSSDKLYVLDE